MKFKNPFENLSNTKQKQKQKEGFDNNTTNRKTTFSIWKLIFFIGFSLIMFSLFFVISLGITYMSLMSNDMDKLESNIDQTLFDPGAFTNHYLTRTMKVFPLLFAVAFFVIFVFLLIINGTKNVSTWATRSLITHCIYFIPSVIITLVTLYAFNFGENTIGYTWIYMRNRISNITGYLYPSEHNESFQNSDSIDHSFDNVLNYVITLFSLDNFVEEFEKFSNPKSDSEYQYISFKNPEDENSKQILRNTMASAVLEKYCFGHAFVTSLIAVLSGMAVISQYEKPGKGITKV